MNIQSVNAGKAREKSLAFLVSLPGRWQGIIRCEHDLHCWADGAPTACFIENETKNSNSLPSWVLMNESSSGTVCGWCSEKWSRSSSSFRRRSCTRRNSTKFYQQQSLPQNKSKGSRRERYRSGVNWNVLAVNGSNDANEKLSTHFPAAPKVSLQSKEAQLMWAEIFPKQDVLEIFYITIH